MPYKSYGEISSEVECPRCGEERVYVVYRWDVYYAEYDVWMCKACGYKLNQAEEDKAVEDLVDNNSYPDGPDSPNDID